MKPRLKTRQNNLQKQKPKPKLTLVLHLAILISIFLLTLILSASLAASVLPPPLSALSIPVQLVYGHGTPHADVRLGAASGTFKWRVSVEIDSPAGPEIGNFMVSLSFPGTSVNGTSSQLLRSTLLPVKSTSHFNTVRPHVVVLTDKPIYIPAHASLHVGRPDWIARQVEVPINAVSIVLSPQKGWVHYVPRPLLWLWATSVGWGFGILSSVAGYFVTLHSLSQKKSSAAKVVTQVDSGSEESDRQSAHSSDDDSFHTPSPNEPKITEDQVVENESNSVLAETTTTETDDDS